MHYGTSFQKSVWAIASLFAVIVQFYLKKLKLETLKLETVGGYMDEPSNLADHV